MVSVPRITVDDIAVPLMSKGTDEEKQEHLHSIRYIKDKVEKYVQKTFVDIGAASTRETFALLEGLRHIKDAKDIADWMLYVDGEMQRQQEFAVTLQRTLDDTIRDAVSRGFITNDSALKWKSRFTNRDVEPDAWGAERGACGIEHVTDLASVPHYPRLTAHGLHRDQHGIGANHLSERVAINAIVPNRQFFYRDTLAR
jgi:hypothetical protein